MSDNQTSQRAEITLLGIVAALAESWILIIVVPVIFGLVTAVYLGSRATTYTSSAILALPVAEAENLLSPEIVDPVLARYGLGGTDAEIAREAFSDRVTIIALTSNEQEGPRSQVIVEDAEANVVQPILASMIEAYELNTGGDNARRDQLALEIQIREDTLADWEALRQRLIADADQGGEGVDRNDTARALSTVLFSIDTSRTAIVGLNKTRDAIPEGIIVSEASTPAPTSTTSRYLTPLVVILVGGILVVFVLLRYAVRMVSADPVATDDLNRIRRAFSFRRRSGSN